MRQTLADFKTETSKLR